MDSTLLVAVLLISECFFRVMPSFRGPYPTFSIKSKTRLRKSVEYAIIDAFYQKTKNVSLILKVTINSPDMVYEFPCNVCHFLVN